LRQLSYNLYYQPELLNHQRTKHFIKKLCGTKTRKNTKPTKFSSNFSVPNHGKLWKSLMRLHLGEYEACEAALQKNAHLTKKRVILQS